MSKHFGRPSGGSQSFPPVWSARQQAVCFVLAMFLMPETRHISIWEPEESKATA